MTQFKSSVRIFILAFFAVLVPLLQAQHPVKAQSINDAEIFDYDKKNALDVREIPSGEQDGVTVKDIEYAAYNPQDGRIKAYLVSPNGKGNFAGILFFHWYGAPEGNRNQFLKEAIELAKRGTISLLIEGRFPWKQAPTDVQADQTRIISQTIDTRRALDLLLSQRGVDKKRVAFVGHDYGAMFGANLAGTDKRVKNFVLLAPIGSFSNWSLDFWLNKWDENKKTAYRNAMEAVDPIKHIARAKNSKLLFQFANTDKYVTKEQATALYEAAAGTKEVKWYDAQHNLNVEAARADRLEWLSAQLKLSSNKIKQK